MKTKRMYIRGTRKNCKDFTIYLMWKHSAAAEFGSVNDDGETVTLNLLVDPDRTEDIEHWSNEFNLKVMNW